MKHIAMVVMVGAVALAGCNKDKTCKAAREDAARVVADKDPRLELDGAKLQLGDAEAKRAALADTKKHFLDDLAFMNEVLGCKTDDKCCEHLVHKKRDARITALDVLASADSRLELFASLPPGLGPQASELGSATLRIGDEARDGSTVDMLATCRDIRQHIATMSANDAAWTDVENDLDAKIAEARATVSTAQTRLQLRGAWADAVRFSKPVVVAEDAGEPQAPDDFREARQAMIRYRSSCR